MNITTVTSRAKMKKAARPVPLVERLPRVSSGGDDYVPPDEEGSTEETTGPTTRSSQKNKNNSVPVDETPSPQADDPFGNV